MENLFSGLQAALFDLDNTLIETHIDFHWMRSEVARLAGTFGMDVPPPRDILGGVASMQDQLLEQGRPEDAARFRKEAFALLQEIELEQCGAPAHIPGAAGLLTALEERGIAVGIVTRNCRLVAEKLLERGDLKCRCLLTRDDVPKTKPDPSHLLMALAALNQPQRRRDAEGGERGEAGGAEDASCTSPLSATPLRLCASAVIPPHACLMVGDHFMDVQAGHAAGMRTVGLLRGKPASHFEACPPDLLVEGPADLLAMLERRS